MHHHRYLFACILGMLACGGSARQEASPDDPLLDSGSPDSADNDTAPARDDGAAPDADGHSGSGGSPDRADATMSDRPSVGGHPSTGGAPATGGHPATGGAPRPEPRDASNPTDSEPLPDTGGDDAEMPTTCNDAAQAFHAAVAEAKVCDATKPDQCQRKVDPATGCLGCPAATFVEASNTKSIARIEALGDLGTALGCANCGGCAGGRSAKSAQCERNDGAGGASCRDIY